LDKIEGGKEVHEKLKAFSNLRTVPNVYILGKHIGGYDDIFAA